MLRVIWTRQARMPRGAGRKKLCDPQPLFLLPTRHVDQKRCAGRRATPKHRTARQTGNEAARVNTRSIQCIDGQPYAVFALFSWRQPRTWRVLVSRRCAPFTFRDRRSQKPARDPTVFPTRARPASRGSNGPHSRYQTLPRCDPVAALCPHCPSPARGNSTS